MYVEIFEHNTWMMAWAPLERNDFDPDAPVYAELDGPVSGRLFEQWRELCPCD